MNKCRLCGIVAMLLMVSCKTRVVVHETVRVVHDTIVAAYDTVYIPAKVHPDEEMALMSADESLEDAYDCGWLGRTRKALDSLCALPLVNETQLGLCVLDLTDGVQVYGYGVRQRMRPASIMKVVTAVTAMSAVMGNEDCFALRAWADKKDANSAPRLLVAGGMDPLLDYNGLCIVADSLVAAGINVVQGIVLDVSLADTARWGEGWCWDDENEARTPFFYKGEGSPRGGKWSSRVAWRQSPETPFVKGLYKALASRKITVKGGVERSAKRVVPRTPKGIRRGQVVNNLKFIAKVRHEWDDVLGPMMKESDNQFAECMWWQLGLLCDECCPDMERVDNAFESLCEHLNLDAGNYYVADGSGRSLYNYVTPELICRLLNHAATQPWFERFSQSLPVMGVDGTLKKRCHGTSACGNVLGKTGTVTGVSSLAGYAISSESHLLCFTIINQGIRAGVMGRDFQDEVCKVLTK